jgi:hypothetical protein
MAVSISDQQLYRSGKNNRRYRGDGTEGPASINEPYRDQARTGHKKA